MWPKRHGFDSARGRRLCAAALLALAPNAVADLAESLWRPAEEDARVVPQCDGAYGAGATIGQSAAPDANAIALAATALRANAGQNTVASGGVTARQGERRLAAPEILLDEGAQRMTSAGPLHVREPGLHLRGHHATVNLASGAALLEDAEIVLPALGWRGEAARIERSDGAVALTAASFTRCPPADRTWLLRAASIEVDEEQRFATARHARVSLGRLPVFYAPYLRFRVNRGRASGFLFPSIGDNDGLDVAVPYYLNLAPHYDATVAGRFLARRGAGVEAEFRRRGRGARTEITGAFLPADDDYDGELSRRDFVASGGAVSAFAPADRWLLDISHRGAILGARTLLDFAAVSDNDYFSDLGAGLASGTDFAVASRVQLERRAEVRYASGGFFARLWAQGFQRLEPGREPHRRLPELQVAYAGDLWGPLAWTLGASWSAFASDAAVDGLTGARRLHLEPRLRLPFAKPWGRLALDVGLRHTAYQASGHASQQARRDVHFASADGSLFFEREAKDGAWQTLEPRLQYFYQSHARQDHLPRFDATALTVSYRQLFHDNRFAGLDRIGDANRLAFGATSRLLSAGGRELLAASIGGVAHLREPRVALTDANRPAEGAVAGELRGALGPLRLGATLAWDANDNALEEAQLGVSYRRDAQRIVHAGVRRREGSATRQTDVALHWPVARRWSVFGRWNHDWRFGQTIEAFAGFGYANCCLEAKVLWHRTIDAPRNRVSPRVGTDQGVLLQIALRGLAGFGGGVDGRLARGIKGYGGTRSP